MRKIENFAQISDLLNAQLKKGVITNNFLRGDDYTREIANGLYIHEADGALLLFRERGTHLVMTFYLHPNAVLSLPETDRPVMTELSCRDRKYSRPSSFLTAISPVRYRISRKYGFAGFWIKHSFVFSQLPK